MTLTSNSYDDLYDQAGQASGLDPLWLKAQGIVESGLNPAAVNSDTGAAGVAQFTPATAQSMNVNVKDPASSIQGQARLMAQNLKQFGDLQQATLAYHGGTNPDNWGPKTQGYLQKVSDTYQTLKQQAANSNVTQPAAPSSSLDSWAGSADTPSQAASSTKEAQHPLDAWAGTSSKSDASSPAEQPDISAPKGQAALPQGGRLNLSISELDDLQAKDPTAYNAYMARKQELARGETAYGLGDVPRSLANVISKVAPDTFNAVATAATPVYAALTGQPQPSQADLESLTSSKNAPAQTFQNALQQRNEEYEAQYGQDPSQGVNRLVGEVVGASPALGAANKLAGGALNVTTRNSPGFASWVAQSPVASFLGGKVASNAVVDPVTGAVTQGSSLGNKALQYLASGTKAAELSVPFTALTNAGSNEPLSNQLAQNAVVSAGAGAALPAISDTAGGIINKGRQYMAGPVDAVTQRAQNALQQLVGGDVGKLDTTEYVPGDKPTLAQAAVENPNVAALDRTLKEGNPAAGQLTIPELTGVERQQEAARRSYLNEITGTPEDLQAARDARAETANTLLYGNKAGEYDKSGNLLTAQQPSIWQSQTKPADVKPVVDAIDGILQGPNKKNDAVVSAMQQIKDKLVNSDGSLESDPETLYRSVIKDINDKLDKVNPMDAASQNMQAAGAQVRRIKLLLNSSIQKSTPEYQKYLDAYSSMSKPVDEMNVLQNKLSFTNQPGEQGVPTLSKVNRALDTISKKQNSTEYGPYDSVSDDTVNKLQNLQKTLQRADNPNLLLRNVGSPTDPKFAARKKVEQLLGTTDSSKFQSLGRDVGAMTGSFVGSMTGLGPAADIAGAGVGAHLGSKGGAFLDKGVAARGSAVKNQLVQMLLNPENLPASGSQLGLIPSVGNNPLLRNTLAFTAPVLAQGNQLRGQ